MTASEPTGNEPSTPDPERELEATVLMVLRGLDADANGGRDGQDRDDLFRALADYGFSCGPVVGDVCAVTGPASRIQALRDHATVMQYDEPVEGADEWLLERMRPVVDHFVDDAPVETFPDEYTTTGGDDADEH